MAGKVVSNRPTASFEFELVDGDSSGSNTVVFASSNTVNLWIDPATIKLRHRIGRGLFGDLWLATHHRVSDDYEEYHEVAVKMLHAVKEDVVRHVLSRLDDVLLRCRGMETVCWIHGFTVVNNRICIIMKFYEGSVGDKMARFKGGNLPLSDVLRYGADVAHGIMDLHSKEILILNLKPFNFLLNGNDQAIVGDIGIPFVFLGISLPIVDMACQLGTPNYMAPEQWEPDVRGPLSVETDSWGFGCSILEMLTGTQPWNGKSGDEIYELVVKRQLKPQIPSGLPPAVENVVISCFEYDFRSRPVMADILHAFNSSLNAVNQDDGGWTDLGARMIRDKPGGAGFTEWFLAKDHLQVGDTVRSKKSPNSSNPKNMDVSDGTIVGLECDTDQYGFVLMRVHGIHDPIRVHVSTLERVTFNLSAGDWVQLKKDENSHSNVGILHSVKRDGTVSVAFIGLERLWNGHYSELQMAKPFCVGQFVTVKPSVFSPRFDWPRKRDGELATGRISQILPNGCLVVKFPGLFSGLQNLGSENIFLADPAEVEDVSFNTCHTVVKKYQHVEDFHWAVRPLVIALGLFTTMKMGLFVGKKLARGRSKKLGKNENVQNADRQHGSNVAWRPPKVTEIFR